MAVGLGWLRFSVDFEVYASFPLVLHKLSSVETERKGRNRRSQGFLPSGTLVKCHQTEMIISSVAKPLGWIEAGAS